MLTELVFILDRSGSMSGLEKDTVGGFNAMLAKQRAEEGEAYISTVLFDNRSEVLHDRVPIEHVTDITEKEYFVRGCTALYDALGGAIRHIRTVHKYARREDLPDKTVFVITTDGMENASRKYSRSRVREMIACAKEEYGWEFLFLGANIDAESAAEEIGIEKERAVRFVNDSDGIALNYETVGCVISEMRAHRCVKEDWKAPIEKDYKKRGL